MSNLGLNVSDVVNVQIVMTPIAAAIRNFGSLLILGDSAVIDVNERRRKYSSIEDVAADFGTSAPEYKAAALYFGQKPQPSVLFIGRWARTASSGVLHGGILSTAEQAIAAFNAITTGAFKITVDGGAEQSITGLNFSADTNLNGVASKITAKLTGAACVWNATEGRFNITSNSTGATSTVSFAAVPASGTDVRALLKIGSTNGGSAVAGIASESLVNSVVLHSNLSNAWYGIYAASSVAASDDDYIEAATYIEATSTSRIFGITTQSTTVLDSTVTTDIASRLKVLGLQRTFTQYSSTNAFAAVSILGRAFSVDFTGSNTTLTIKFKQEPGVTAENLTTTQAATLKSKNCNVFVQYNNDTSIIQEGVMANGYFFDEVHGADWLQNDVQTAVYNLLYTSPTKIAQTDAGVNQILSTVARRLEQAVTNGFVAPGQWDGPGFGALNSGDFLSKGYYLYAPPVATQSQAARESRVAPTIQAAIKLAGAVHKANIIVNVNR